MNERARIMCAVDLSWHSERAFEYALTIAESQRAPLDLLCAVSDRRPSSRRARERVARLAELRQRASEAGLDMSVTVQHGNPADVILRHAESSGSPRWIVLGAPNRRGFDRLWWPSVAHAVVHRTVHPTLVVPGSASVARRLNVPLRRVLCATDFSTASMSALQQAYRIISADEGSTLLLVHVVNIAQPAVPRMALEFSIADYTEQLRENAWRQLRGLLPSSQDLARRVQIDVAVGLVVDQIVRNANEMKADVVVLGVTKRGPLRRLLGSTTGDALGRLACPVLAVPAPQDEVRADLTLDSIAA